MNDLGLGRTALRFDLAVGSEKTSTFTQSTITDITLTKI